MTTANAITYTLGAVIAIVTVAKMTLKVLYGQKQKTICTTAFTNIDKRLTDIDKRLSALGERTGELETLSTKFDTNFQYIKETLKEIKEALKK